MKILVPVKRVVDPYVKIRIKQDGTGVETHQVKMVMNPFDEIALEEALRLKERGLANEIICVSIGELVSQETLRHGLALGADKGILVQTDQPFDSLGIAKILFKIVQEHQINLVLLGKQSIDNDANQTPQMLAGLLDWPQATCISKMELEGQCLTVTRETDLGLESLKVSMPAVVSVDLRLNEPRYASLPNIMKAKSKPLQVCTISDLGLDVPKKNVTTIEMKRPPVRERGVILHDVSELMEKIRPMIHR